jgi:hypothetical protein
MIVKTPGRRMRIRPHDPDHDHRRDQGQVMMGDDQVDQVAGRVV